MHVLVVIAIVCGLLVVPLTAADLALSRWGRKPLGSIDELGELQHDEVPVEREAAHVR